MYGKLTQFLDDTQNGTIKADVQLYLKGNDHDLSGLGINESSVVRTNRKKVVDLADCAIVDLDENAQFLKQIDNQYSFVAMSQEEKDEALFKTSLWEGKPIINIPLNLFIDDMSGNVSRRWSPLHIVQGQIAGLPIKEKRRNETTMFISASESVSMMDLLAPICADINTCKENGVNAFDAKLQKEVTVTTDISVLVTDYQMTSLACNHMGPSASKFCPKCYSDTSNPFSRDQDRSPKATVSTLNRLKILGNESKLAKESGLKVYDNCLWKYISPQRDTPVGTLHFLYLGLAKHLIQDNPECLSKEDKLQGIICCGGNIANLKNPSDITVFPARACQARNGVVRLGQFVQYSFENEDHIGRIVAMAIVQKSYSIAKIEQASPHPHSSKFQYLKIQPNQTPVIIPTTGLIQAVHTIHDCLGGRCAVRESNVRVRMEQENVSKLSINIRHNEAHNIFVLNKFRLSHTQDEFTI